MNIYSQCVRLYILRFCLCFPFRLDGSPPRTSTRRGCSETLESQIVQLHSDPQSSERTLWFPRQHLMEVFSLETYFTMNICTSVSFHHVRICFFPFSECLCDLCEENCSESVCSQCREEETVNRAELKVAKGQAWL